MPEGIGACACHTPIGPQRAALCVSQVVSSQSVAAIPLPVSPVPLQQTVAVGTVVAGRPRADPYERDSRIRLLPRVLDEEALLRPRRRTVGNGRNFFAITFMRRLIPI